MNLDRVRRRALLLPEATEQPHFDMTSFRVRGKIFATVPPGNQVVHIFVDESEVRACVTSNPRAFEELWWGKKLSGVRVKLGVAKETEVAELLEDSWRRKAPKRLAAAHDADKAPSAPKRRTRA